MSTPRFPWCPNGTCTCALEIRQMLDILQAGQANASDFLIAGVSDHNGAPVIELRMVSARELSALMGEPAPVIDLRVTNRASNSPASSAWSLRRVAGKIAGFFPDWRRNPNPAFG